MSILSLFLWFFFKKMGQTRPLFFVYFRSFQANIITIFTTNICEKSPSSIRCRDSNPRPLEHESLPITTRPGLPPNLSKSILRSLWFDPPPHCQFPLCLMGGRAKAIFLCAVFIVIQFNDSELLEFGSFCSLPKTYFWHVNCMSLTGY